MSRLNTAPESFRVSDILSPRVNTSVLEGSFSFQSNTKSNGPNFVSNPIFSSLFAISVAGSPFVPKYITRYVLYPMVLYLSSLYLKLSIRFLKKEVFLYCYA